jgi:signal transduction histidine kinase
VTQGFGEVLFTRSGDNADVRGIRIGMRWWLAGAFVAVAALTAALIATISSLQTGRAVTANARNLAIGETVSAGFALGRSADLEETARAYGDSNGLALFVFARDGTLVARAPLPAVGWTNVPDGHAALRRALAGRRFAESFHHGDATVVALPMRHTTSAAALVAYAPRSRAYGASLSIFRNEVLRVSIWAALAAALIGVVVSILVMRRVRRNAFDEVQAERDRLELLLDRLHEAVIAVDRRLSVQYANASMRSLLPELDPDVPLPERFGDLPLRAVASSLFRRGARVSEARVSTDDGAIYSLVGIPAASTGLAVLVLADITQHERRQRAEREFVANASHELRTPVSAIASAVEALELGARDVPEERDRFIAVIGRQAARLTRLTSSLLVLARAQTREEGVQLVPVELDPFLERLAESTDQPADVRVERNGGGVALAQPDVLEQVIANLVANAAKHAPGAAVVLRAHRAGDDAVIEVVDRGPGMPADVRARVFDRFYSGYAPGRDGFGLGLAIARESTAAMGGRLELESEPGAGTTARVILRSAS